MENVWKIRAPLTFLIFNRPETTRIVFEEIRKARPSRLYVIADGPREGFTQDVENCRLARAVVESVDWPCEVFRRFSDVNLGSMRNISSGLDWLFTLEEEAVILEDDCLPVQSFFRFCDELLEKYRDDDRLSLISGDNFQFGGRKFLHSYYFSRYNHCWGWATWRKAWQANDNEMIHWADFRDSGKLASVLDDRREIKYWTEVLDLVSEGKIDSWACRWLLANWRQHRLAVLPTVNLVTNIGFGPNATNTKAKCRFDRIPAYEIDFPLTHPVDLVPDRDADNYTGEIMFTKPHLFQKAFNLIKSNFYAL